VYTGAMIAPVRGSGACPAWIALVLKFLCLVAMLMLKNKIWIWH